MSENDILTVLGWIVFAVSVVIGCVTVVAWGNRGEEIKSLKVQIESYREDIKYERTINTSLKEQREEAKLLHSILTNLSKIDSKEYYAINSLLGTGLFNKKKEK